MAKDWYDENILLNILWTVTGVIYLPINLVYLIFKIDRPKWLRWWGNRVDNLSDAIVQWIHCHKIPFTNKQFNLSFMMKNRETYGKIIRPHANWCNCDPEDYDESLEDEDCGEGSSSSSSTSVSVSSTSAPGL